MPEKSPASDFAITAPRCGRIIIQRGALRQIDRLRLPRRFTISRVWIDSYFRTGSEDTCTLYYSGTRATPGYLTLDYVRSGTRTTFQTFRQALIVLDRIARLRQSVAIFAHVGTSAISDRLLCRWGWQQHAARLGGRQWIKRFYDGYPEHSICDGRELAHAMTTRHGCDQ